MAVQLKRWQTRVAANDSLAWAHTKAQALVENDSEILTEDAEDKELSANMGDNVTEVSPW